MKMSNQSYRMIMLASAMATKSTLACRHGAILVSGGKIISRGYNIDRNQFGGKLSMCNISMPFTNYCSIHAEVCCLLRRVTPKYYPLQRKVKFKDVRY